MAASPLDSVSSAANTDPAGMHAIVPRRTLSVWDAIMITVGIVIGAGIFQTPATVAGIAGSVPLTIAVWVAGGILSLIGALTYAELATSYPSAGGDYTFLTRAYGKHVSFLFAWARSTVIVTGSIALLGFILGDYLTRLYSLGPYSSSIYAAAAVVLLTGINLIGLKSSARMQNVLTIVEIGGVLLVAGAAFTLGPPEAVSASVGTGGSVGTFGLALVFVLLAYGGWNEAAYVSAEVRGGPGAMVRTLVLSILVITFIYVLFVAAILHGLGWEGVKSSQAIGIDVMERAFGPAGAQVIGVVVAVAALTSMNSTILVGARSNFAVGNDWPMLSFLARWRDERNIPVTGFLIQAAIALALVAFGAMEKSGFSTMVEFTAPVFWFFFMLNGIALFVLRRKDPGLPRPFKVPAYPVLPLIFIATCAYLLYSSITYAQSQNAGFVALGAMVSGAVALGAMHLRRS
jgi:APA family basic amino acid/polyamine antiporter